MSKQTLPVVMRTNHRGAERLTIREPLDGQHLFEIRIDDGGAVARMLLDRDEVMSLGQCLTLMANRLAIAEVAAKTTV